MLNKTFKEKSSSVPTSISEFSKTVNIGINFIINIVVNNENKNAENKKKIYL